MTFAKPEAAPDWSDTVYGSLNITDKSCREMFEYALEKPPAWMGAAMSLRNLIVSPFGIKTSLEGEGHFLLRMPVLHDTPDHFETGIDDKHLTFTLSFRKSAGSGFLTTNIWFNSWLGKFYLLIIKPGHILATKQMLGRVTKLPIHRTIGGFSEAANQ